MGEDNNISKTKRRGLVTSPRHFVRIYIPAVVPYRTKLQT